MKHLLVVGETKQTNFYISVSSDIRRDWHPFSGASSPRLSASASRAMRPPTSSARFFPRIPFLNFAYKSLVVPFNLLQIIIGELAPLLFQIAFEMGPFSFELLRIHCILLLYETS